MAQTYEQIQKQIAELQSKAQALRNKEVDGVVARIKVAIEHYGLTAGQLGFDAQTSSLKNTRSGKATAVSSPAKGYADGFGRTWSGRGPRPGWLKDALAAGKTLEELAASGKAATVEGRSAKSSAPKKRKAKQSYKDDAGHFWSGFGPQPAWLKEAVASGRKLEEFAA